MDHQIQCPNCGGYDIEPTSTTGCLGSALEILGIGLIIPYIILHTAHQNKDWDLFYEGKNTAECQLCHFKFYESQIPSIPIQPNSKLINDARKKIEEERRKRIRD